MSLVIFGAVIIGFISWIIAIFLRAFGIVDIEWKILLFPFYSIIIILILFTIGVMGLISLLDFIAK
jgi:hypothetical protein